MELAPRFTNRAIRALKDSNGIDLFSLGESMSEEQTRKAIMLAGHPTANAADVLQAFDDLTPGETMEILTTAIIRDLVPASQREASAKAATPTKSEG